MTEFESKEIRLDLGTIRYREGGSGPAIVFVHGFLADGRLWDGPARKLGERFRCVLPDWPLGSHRLAMSESADLSPPGVARLISDFLDALELEDVTLVGNDSGGAISQIVATRHPQRLGRLVLTNCDTHENFPPAPFGLMRPIAKMPGGMTAMQLPFRLRALRNATFRQFSHTVPQDLIESWMEPSLRDPEIKRDVRKFTIGVDKRYTMEAAEQLKSFDRPVLLAWGRDDSFFKLSYAERLAAAIPDVRLEAIEDCKTFVALDQPDRLAELIAEFVPATTAAPAGQAG